MNPELSITIPQPEQAEAMIELRAQLFKEELIRCGVGSAAAARHVYPWATPEGRANFQCNTTQQLHDPTIFIRIVQSSTSYHQQVAGLFVARIADQEEPAHFVYSVQLHRSIRGRGIGRRLFQEFSNTAGTSQPTDLEVFERNDPAKRFYAKLGFIGVKQYRSVMIGGNGGEAHTLMRLRLPGPLEARSKPW